MWRMSGPLIVPCGSSSGRCTLIPTTTRSRPSSMENEKPRKVFKNLCYTMAAVEEMGGNESIIKVKMKLWAGTFVGIQERKMLD